MEMTREEQLDAVVRNYGEWKGKGNQLAFLAAPEFSVVYLHSPSDKMPVSGSEYLYGFTSAEVEQRKTELQNKPGWGDAPDDFEDDAATLTDEGAKQPVKPLAGDTWKYVNRSAGERFANLQLCDILDISGDETAIVRLMSGKKRAIPISDLNNIVYRPDFIDLRDKEVAKERKSNSELYPQYFKDVSCIEEIDVYGVHQLFEIDDPSGAIQHASKKLLLSGVRTGGKSKYKDIKEARDTLNRWLELNNE